MDRSLMKKTLFWTAVSGLLYASVSFLLPMITSWGLDNEHGGIISTAILIATQLLTVGLFSVRTFQISDHQKEYSFSDYFSFRILTALLMAAAGAVWILTQGYTGQKALVILLMVLYKGIEVFSDVFEGEFQQQGRFYIAGRIMALQNACNLLTFLVVLILTKELAWAVLFMDLVFAAIVFVVNPLVLKKKPRVYLPSFSKKTVSLLLLCFPAFLNAFLLMYLDNCSKFAVNSRVPDEIFYEFSTLFMCVFVINLFASFFLKTYLKQCSDDYHEHRMQDLKKTMLRQAVMVAGLTVVCLAGAQLIGLWLLSKVYHCELMGYRLELTVLLIAGGVNAVNSMLLNVLVIMRKQKLCLVLTGICAVVTLVLLPQFMKLSQMFLGAGLGYLTAVVLLLGLYLAAALRQIRKEQQ